MKVYGDIFHGKKRGEIQAGGRVDILHSNIFPFVFQIVIHCD